MKFPKLNLKTLSSISYGATVRPQRDWFVLISVGLVLFIASAGWNAWLFYRVFNGEVLTTDSGAPAASVTNDTLSKAEAIFSKRSAEESRYRKEYHFVDPSL